MAVKTFKPTSPARRFQEVLISEEITPTKPLKQLVRGLKKSGGRNNMGHATIRHRGGGHKRKYRVIDFKREKWDIPAKVASIEYDPNRSSNIALLHYADGEKRYIIAPLDLKVGDTIITAQKAEISEGNCLPLENIPLGTIVHNIELIKGKGGQLARSAGASAQIIAKEGNYVQLKLPSGEVRKVHMKCCATIGQVGNVEHSIVSLGKAGRNRWLGQRPRVRGVAMNPVDHPLGGGEGKSAGGRHPCTPWGKPTKGYKTRSNKRTDKYIIRRKK